MVHFTIESGTKGSNSVGGKETHRGDGITVFLLFLLIVIVVVYSNDLQVYSPFYDPHKNK